MLIIIPSAFCKEVAYSYGASGSHPLDSGNVTEYRGSDLVTYAIASVTPDGRPTAAKARTVDEIKKEINQKLNVGNHAVRDEGRRLILEYPGDGTISQICSIYDYLVGNWSYARDTRGIEEFQYSNKSLEYGKGKFSGQGDCDDFSILLASLIESIGGTSRIVLAYGSMGGHAYTEVYLGKAEGVDCKVDRMIKWLRNHYKVTDINTHTDLDTGDVWLNLDWWKDPNTGVNLTKHPGGPFFDAKSQTPIFIREDISKVPLEPLNDQPIAQFSISPASPNATENVTFDASSSRDIGIGETIESYLWTFGDGWKGEGKIVTHVYSQGNRYQVDLKVTDNDGASNSSIRMVEVNALPVPIINYQPKEPKTNDAVSFDGSMSWDKEDVKVSKWQWEFGDGDSSKKEYPAPHKFEIGNIYAINLTVCDKRDACNTTSLLLGINDPPIADFIPDKQDANVGESIRFDASSSKDLDGGTLENFAWDFGDGIPAENKSIVRHDFTSGGDKTVKLVVVDNEGAKSTSFSYQIRINKPPIAAFDYNITGGNNVEFNASSSKDEDGKIRMYMWDLDDYSGILQSEKNIVMKQYIKPGKYNVTLTVIDDKESMGSVSHEIVLEGAPQDAVLLDTKPAKLKNQRPIACFFFNPIEPYVGEEIFFDASCSSDPDGTVTDYGWDFGDGVETNVAPGIDIRSHVFNKAGYFKVTLEVMDNTHIHEETYCQVLVKKKPSINETITTAINETDVGAPTGVRSSGSLQITPMQAVDLDSGSIESRSGGDILYNRIGNKRYIEPDWTGQIVYLSDRSMLSQGISYPSRSLKITVDPELEGMYIGVITSEGRRSEIRVWYVDSEGRLNLDYRTLNSVMHSY
jgi:PKD repeat protein